MKIAVMNQKGGVGKTTVVHNLLVGLARRGLKVLGVDLDPQANLTTGFGVDPENGRNILSLMNSDVKYEDIIASKKGVDIIPSSLELAEFDLLLSGEMMRESKIKLVISKLEDNYDYILLDCGPTLGLLTINAMVAVDKIFIPLQTEFYSMAGLKSLIKTINKVKDNDLNSDLSILGIVLTLFDSRTRLHKQVLDVVKENFKEELFSTKIRINTDLATAPSHYKSIFDYAPRSNGAQDFHALLDEFLKKVKKKELTNV